MNHSWNVSVAIRWCWGEMFAVARANFTWTEITSIFMRTNENQRFTNHFCENWRPDKRSEYAWYYVRAFFFLRTKRHIKDFMKIFKLYITISWLLRARRRSSYRKKKKLFQKRNRRSLFAWNRHAKLSVQNIQNGGSFLYAPRNIAAAIHAGTIYFYLGRKSPVVMEIYCGLNIDINARQRLRRKVEWAIVAPKSRSKIFLTRSWTNHLLGAMFHHF